MAVATLTVYGLGLDTSMYLWGSTDGSTYSLLGSDDIGTLSQSSTVMYGSGSRDNIYLKLSTSSTTLTEITTYQIISATDNDSGTWIVDSYAAIHRTSTSIAGGIILTITVQPVQPVSTGTIKFGSSSIDKIMLGSTEVLKVYLGSNVVYEQQTTPQLDTPTNLTASGTSITFDEVTNATSYEVFADGVSIGTYEVPQYVYTQSGDILTLSNAPYSQSADELTIL